MSETPLIVSRRGAVVDLCFNRPQALNALDIDTAAAFLAACREIAADPGVRAVVMRGAGRAFVAGGDLRQLQADPQGAADALIGPLHEGLQLLAAADAPLIASVHGAVAGAGLSLMLAADFALAAEGTRFSLAYVNIGASCDVGASWALPRVVGLRRALEIALLGERFEVDEAARLGLVNRVVPAERLEAETQLLAERLAQGPTRALGHIKRLMRQSFDRDLAGQLAAEQASFKACAGTQDFAEALDAFFAKRAPRFEGR